MGCFLVVGRKKGTIESKWDQISIPSFNTTLVQICTWVIPSRNFFASVCTSGAFNCMGKIVSTSISVKN